MTQQTTVSMWSRDRFAVEMEDEDGTIFATDYEPFGFRPETDNRAYVARDGDTWAGVAFLSFPAIPRACGLWWALADYQPEPVVDPTLAIAAGRVVVIPSERVLRQLVFASERRREQ